MYHSDPQSFSSDKSLLDYLSSTTGEGEVAVVAGHFMLMYDDQLDRLVPMIHQDSSNSRVTHLCRLMAGDFPLKTFKLGIETVQRLGTRSIPAKLVLIVNDHIFQTPTWETQGLADLSRAGQLRHDFYRQKYPIPKSFYQALKQVNLETESILDNNNSRRSSADIVPKITRFFSEQALRNAFDDYTRPELRKLKGFNEVKGGNDKTQLIFTPHTKRTEMCLTEQGSCGCSGEIIEFLMRLAERGFRSLIFFVPDECRIPANQAVEAFLHLPESYRRELSQVTCIFGLGGMGAHGSHEKISVVRHYLELSSTKAKLLEGHGQRVTTVI